MVATATFTPGPLGRFALKFDYNQALVDELKNTVPSYARAWNPAQRRWEIDNTYRADVETLLDYWGYRFHRERRRTSPGPSQTPPGGWAAALFAAIPERLHKPVYQALLKVLHPDTGGDLAACQQLNDARPRP